MRNNFFILLLLIALSNFAQTVIKGTVYYEKGPLENVAVYLNNTMLGTTTNENGKFSIPVKDGQYELIVSYLGYKKINYALNTSTYKKPLVFTLEESADVLDEIVLKKIVYDEKWKNNLAVFKREFIGNTELAADCEILNPEVLSFEYEFMINKLTAYARKPLIIKHKSLGYLITFELERFIINDNYITYLGYSRYQQLKGGKRKQKRWQKNRLKAYNGSPVHFYKSLLKDNFTQEGFIVNQFKRVPNPERPSEEKIKRAKEIIRANRSVILNLKKNKIPQNALDSALIISRKSRLPKFKDYLYKSKLKKEDILAFKDNAYQLIFENNLSIVYTKEKEEMGYITRGAFSKPRKPLPQTSAIIPMDDKIVLDVTGILVNPLAVFYDGYWSYEKFANALPLDYVPEN
ncbi:carboxypeptidase-like regulatory domain-containing protein [Polaribacter sp.]|uniref:carboxypeptidase-like regulatory domain-containing protein n=1 Tax=Polaribacter sp. TaxID=1920175 RepID=UPI003F6B0E7F